MKEQWVPFNIVCFGDSLTLGWESPTFQSPIVANIPYGKYLEEWLEDRGRICVRGVCGETTQDMRARFQIDVLDQKPTAVIILGGTNDLGLGMTPHEILDNLRFFYEQAQTHQILPIAITVPSLRDDSWQNVSGDDDCALEELPPVIGEAIAARVILNQLIKDCCQERHISIVDWFTETCEPKTQALAACYSNDGLHLNTAGYKRLAELLWVQVIKGLLA